MNTSTFFRLARLVFLLAVTGAVSLGSVTLASAADGSGFPSLIIESGLSRGGYGRLDFLPEQKAYALVDGRLTPFVFEGEKIRAMRPDEGGGSMAVLKGIVSMNGSIFGLVPSSGSFLKLDGNLTILKQGQYGPLGHSGAMKRFLTTHRGFLLLCENNALQAVDENLTKISETKLPDAMGYLDEFTITGDRAYLFAARDKGPATERIAKPNSRGDMVGDGPEPSDRFVVQSIINLTDPRKPIVEKDEVLTDPKPPVFTQFKGVDPAGGFWLIITGLPGSPVGQIRTFAAPNVVAGSLPIPGRILAMTDAAPFFAVISTGERISLLPITTKQGTITLGARLDLDLQAEKVLMRQTGHRLFIAAGSQLRVVSIQSEPRIEHSQNFVTQYQGDLFQITNFAIGDRLSPVDRKADKKRLEALLGLESHGPDRLLELQSELDKLTGQDIWALPLLEAVLKKEGQASLLHPEVVRGLGNIGPDARLAIPSILDSAMSGSAVRGEMTAPISDALRKIDPAGETLLDELAAFQKRKYEAGARMVSKEVLSVHPSAKAKEALKGY